MSEFNWVCPHCEHAVTISDERYTADNHTLDIENSDGRCTLRSIFIVCPNHDCRKFTLTAELRHSVFNNTRGEILQGKLNQWALIPATSSKHFPDYVPNVILNDYKEACLIRDLSPKASATLSRRCLQGILRDYWEVKPDNLVKEIEQIKDRVDHITWDAIDAVRKLGNIRRPYGERYQRHH